MGALWALQINWGLRAGRMEEYGVVKSSCSCPNCDDLTMIEMMVCGCGWAHRGAWVIITTRAQLVERHQHHCINGALITVWWSGGLAFLAPRCSHTPINSNSVFLLLLFFSLGKKKVKKVENEPKSESIHREKLEEKGKGWWKNTFFTQTHCWNEVMIYGFPLAFPLADIF